MSATFAAAARMAARLAAHVGWPPEVFWAATPADLRNALGLDDDTGAAGLDRAAFARLMEAFPDE